ncbi:MAG TPA: type IV toxin-antitoxin system AbiEi family antitoxin domain-containing protein [Actinomycetota bacterium]|nr:type IV toxin-antitoxin system AbiEi family antitoxin domain-containing protein [Actinomycetota bacterium]
MGTARRAGCDREREARMLRLAARQHGVVTRAQAIETGLTKSMVQTRVRTGRLRRIHPGVYCVGGSPATFEQRAFAAAAWAGPGAVLSHRSAGYLWGLVDRHPPVDELWTPRRRTRPPAASVHTSRRIWLRAIEGGSGTSRSRPRHAR